MLHAFDRNRDEGRIVHIVATQRGGRMDHCIDATHSVSPAIGAPQVCLHE